MFMEKIELQRIIVKETVAEYSFHYSDGLRRFFNLDRIFIDFGQDISNVPVSMLTIPFVTSMSGLSWISDAVIYVDQIDETFYHSYNRIKSAYQELHSDYQFKGILVPSVIVANSIQKNDEAVLLFSGGIDCQTSYLRNRERVPFVCCIEGWMSSEDEDNPIDSSEKEFSFSFAKRMGISALHVRSNLFSAFNLGEIDSRFEKKLHTGYWFGFLHSMSFIAIAMQLCVALGVSNVMIASSYFKGRADLYCASLVTTDSEFSFATNGRTIHDGFELNRQDKVGLIVSYQKQTGGEYPLLVCSFNDHNCCECEKCFRTIVGIAAEGADPKLFGFDYSGTLTEHLKGVMNNRLWNWGLSNESYYYYDFTKARIRENLSLNKLDKEFAEWFLNFDFVKEHRKALISYYKKNFFSIMKRKIRDLGSHIKR